MYKDHTMMGGIVVGAIVAGGIALYAIFGSADDNSKADLLDLKNEMPVGYYDLPEKPKPKPKPIKKKPKPKPIKKKPKPKPVEFQFVEKNKVDVVQIKRQSILNDLTNESFVNSSDIDKKHEFEVPEFVTPKKINKTNPSLTSDDFGLYKNTASNRVDLSRTITADNMFSAILITAINSHLKGKVKSMIEDNIYASHGRNILIPKGSTAIGWYIPIKALGTERLAISWTRIITPAGVNINLKALSADLMGRSGAIGDLDNRYFARYGLALSISTATNSLSYAALKSATGDGATYEDDLKVNIVDDYRKDISSLTNEILKEQLKVTPSINIEAGKRIFINPIDDIWFSQAENNNIDVSLVNPQILKKGE